MELIVFYATAAIALVSALVAVSHRNPIVNVLALVVTFFCVAVCYALLGASFLAAAQILVYAGAILVLFLFVVMLLNAPEEQAAGEPRPVQGVAGFALTAVAAIGGVLLLAAVPSAEPASPPDGHVVALGRLLVGPYLFAFELISVLLLAALVGALVLVKRKH
ncbi:MAG: NADH-quinone oxidoreductase subunit J [Acidobacteriota bacterium]